ncbi:hypothetical protein R3P38DRAFT_2803444 [Favolaschia claudopus]|uniref:Uncharacterized protein n=1 Tax=Favolaschia claudopus TaxID=2862362 RepID=A0AAV9ZT77_9AGAR
MASAEDIQGIQAFLDDTSIHVLTLDHMNCTFSSRYYWETTMPLMPEVLSLTSTAKTLRIRGWEGGEHGFTMEREDELLETNTAVQRTLHAGVLFSGISQLIVLNTLAPELCWDIPWHNLVNYAQANVIGRQPETGTDFRVCLHISSEDWYDNDKATRQARIAWFEHFTILFLERSVRLELGREYGYDADMCQLLHSESLWPRLATLRLPRLILLIATWSKRRMSAFGSRTFVGALRVADFTATIRGEGPSTRDELWKEESEWGNGRIVALPPGLRDALAVLHLEGYAVRWRVPSDEDLDHKARMLLQEALTDQP